MVVLWLQQVTGHGHETCSDSNEGTLGHQHQSGEWDALAEEELWSTRCGGGWREAIRAGGQLNGCQQVVTACLKTDPSGDSTFLVRTGHVNEYVSSR